MSTIVLGIDPGFATCGLAAVEVGAGGLNPLGVKVVTTSKSSKKLVVRSSEDNIRRCHELAEQIEGFILHWRPVAIAAETMSWPRNAGAAAKVALAWGVIAETARRHMLPLVQASPMDVKRALLGRKSASKDEMIFEVERRWPELDLPTQTTLQEHAADAVAVVLACRDSEVLRLAARMASAQAERVAEQ